MTEPAMAKPKQGWQPPERVGVDELRRMSNAFLARPTFELDRREDVSRIEAAGLEWDIGAIVYQPKDTSKIRVSPDGRKLGFFVMHGGAGDFRVHEKLGQLLATRLGARVVNLTYPGRFYFDDPEHNWPGDTIKPDGSMRMPIWKRGEIIGRDQYDIVNDAKLRKTYGTLQLAQAKPGTIFYDRMAAWPLAFETAIIELCRKYFPVGEYSVYAHGHSTGGPFSHMLLQRVPNAVGITGIENSPFGYIWAEVNGNTWSNPFNALIVRTWRDIARYRGAEVLRSQGPEALMSLPALIEDVFQSWNEAKHLPQIKAEFILHINCVPALKGAAEATAKRLGLSAEATGELVQRYLNYPKPLTGPGTKPVPPLLYIICANSRDHTEKAYKNIILKRLSEITPPPKTALVQFGTGVHNYQRPLEGMPMGLIPCAIMIWEQAIDSGYYLA